uniref:Major facilitator superfamily domain-containing protein 6-A n=2 Tax=Cacopsylla melanoneura TaxID=428564 RepID=A0A8D8M315_9HEMI
MPLIEINFDLLPMKIHYFLWNAGTAPIVPFVPTLAKQLGFSTVTVGTIFFTLPFFGLLAKPFFGAISDRFKVQKPLFLAFILLTASTFYCILYIPNVQTESLVKLECGEGRSSFQYCSNQPADSCLRKKILQSSNETTYHCEIICQTNNSQFLDALCNSWHVPQFCAPEPQTPQFVNALIPSGTGLHNVSKKLDPSKVGKYDVHPKTSWTSSQRAGTKVAPSLVRFTAHVPAFHIVEVDTCLHIPFTHVRFLSENKTTSHIPTCTSPIDIPGCSVSCDSNEIMSYLSTLQDDVTDTYQFWLFFAFLSLSWIGMAVVVSLGDTICFELLGTEPQKYGKQRLWGAVGWGMCSLLAGFLVDHFSSSALNKNYTPVFYLMLAILLFDTFVSSKIKNVQTSVSPNIFKDVFKLLTEARVLAFLFWCVGVGLCTAVVWQYLFWYLENLAMAQGCDHSNWIKTLQGILMTVQCLGGELPFFFLSGWFLRKLGHVNSMTLVLLSFSVRFYLYSLLTDPWWAIPIEVLNGLSFGLFWPCMASYANIVASPGTEATVQGLVGAVFEGVGVSLGSLLGGWIFDVWGGRETFVIFAVLSFIMAMLHIVFHYLLKMKAQYGLEDDIKDRNQRARYASPTEAIHMLEDVNT